MHAPPIVRRTAAAGAAVLCAVLLSGCWNGHNNHTNLGDSTIGKQLLDLHKAREKGVINEAEYQQLRGRIIALASSGADGADGDADE